MKYRSDDSHILNQRSGPEEIVAKGKRGGLRGSDTESRSIGSRGIVGKMGVRYNLGQKSLYKHIKSKSMFRK